RARLALDPLLTEGRLAPLQERPHLSLRARGPLKLEARIGFEASRAREGAEQDKLGPEAPREVGRLLDSLLCGSRPICPDGHGGDHPEAVSTQIVRCALDA